MSIHTDKAFNVATRNGAASARTRETWESLMALSKREMAEVAMHLAALCTDSYDDALDGNGALERLMAERAALRANGIL